MKKILFIRFQEEGTIPDGGERVLQRDSAIAEILFGKENIDSYNINPHNKKRNILSLIKTAIYFPFGYYKGLTPSKIKEIISLAKDYECVLISTSLLGIIGKKLKESGYKGKIVVQFHNVESIYYECRVPKWLPGRKIIIRCAYRNDGFSLHYADCCMAMNKRDTDILQQLYGKTPEYVIPVTFVDKAKNSVTDNGILTGKRPKCLFLGNNFPPNAEGLLWFVKEVLPHINIDFEVVGKNMDKLQNSNSCLKDIKVSSNVPDIAPYFESADFMICPIFSGSGMKVKTCEGLMYGKNILGTTETFVGYDIDTNKCGRLCNDAKDYISAIKELCKNPIPRYNTYSRTIFLKKYSQDAAINAFKILYHDIGLI